MGLGCAAPHLAAVRLTPERVPSRARARCAEAGAHRGLRPRWESAGCAGASGGALRSRGAGGAVDGADGADGAADGADGAHIPWAAGVAGGAGGRGAPAPLTARLPVLFHFLGGFTLFFSFEIIIKSQELQNSARLSHLRPRLTPYVTRAQRQNRGAGAPRPPATVTCLDRRQMPGTQVCATTSIKTTELTTQRGPLPPPRPPALGLRHPAGPERLSVLVLSSLRPWSPVPTAPTAPPSIAEWHPWGHDCLPGRGASTLFPGPAARRAACEPRSSSRGSGPVRGVREGATVLPRGTPSDHKGTCLPAITLNVSSINSPIQKHRVAEWTSAKDPSVWCVRQTHSRREGTHGPRSGGGG